MGGVDTVALNLGTGGTISNNEGYIGFDADSGSTWVNSRSLAVGLGGDGTLNVEDGGRVEIGGNLIFATNNSASGTVHLTGGTVGLNDNDVVFGAGTAEFSFTGGTLADVSTFDSSLDQHDARRKLLQIDVVDSVEELAVPPGNRLKKLGGDRAG